MSSGPLVVLGDVLLDVDRIGSASRMSPEAPVPVLTDVVERARPGGAGLAALLAARSRERPVVLVAPLARDEAADRIRSLLDGAVELRALPAAGSTPVKIRLFAGSHPVARIDSGAGCAPIGPATAELEQLLERAGAILVADYGGGTTSQPAVRALLGSLSHRIPVVWDPHPRGAAPVPGVLLATPNVAELHCFDPDPITRAADAAEISALTAAARRLALHWRTRAMVVTRGARGALLLEGDAATPVVIPSAAVLTGDTCGAGDRFAATCALRLAAGDLPSEAVVAAVADAGAFVAAGGAAGIDVSGRWEPDERPYHDVDAVVERVRAAGGTIVATGGCFDLLHAGHVATLEAARRLGDCLVVCLNDDASVRRLKGAGRPLQNAADRARVLAGLEVVDAVVTFAEDTPEGALRRLRPHIWVKGGDYSGIELPEQRVLGEWGGVAVTVPYLAGRSTTALVAAAGRHQVAAR